MSLDETYRVERTKWDALAEQKLSSLRILPPEENFHTYAQRSSTMVGVSEFLGDLSDQQVLEYGCGLGEISTLLAKSGAHVTTFDLSSKSVFTCRQRAKLNGVDTKIKLAVAAGEHLPYADESFDVIFGKAILHHLDAGIGGCDIGRVLKPGGRAVFVEPMGMNPILNFVRDHVPYPHKNPRGADRPLNYNDIQQWGKGFRKFWYREIQLLSMLERGLGFRKHLGLFRKIDDFLLRHLPFLRRFCRYIVMYYVK
jgi:SAM-dependent methyltransferase